MYFKRIIMLMIVCNCFIGIYIVHPEVCPSALNAVSPSSCHIGVIVNLEPSVLSEVSVVSVARRAFRGWMRA